MEGKLPLLWPDTIVTLFIQRFYKFKYYILAQYYVILFLSFVKLTDLNAEFVLSILKPISLGRQSRWLKLVFM